MIRDMELIKQLLKYVRCEGPGARGFLFHPDIPSYSEDQVGYHIRLLRCGLRPGEQHGTPC